MNREQLSNLGMFLILVAFLLVVFAPEVKIAALSINITGLVLFCASRYVRSQDD